jgi:RND superfamily putative drug exporter
MDYQVFLVSRIHEEWGATGDNNRAVQAGMRDTGRVIATAAAIMLCVFASFGLSGERIVSEIGIGLGCAVLVDALVVRMTLVPALMTLIGRANWHYPRWAARITPRLSIEDSGDSRPAEREPRWNDGDHLHGQLPSSEVTERLPVVATKGNR